MPTPDRFFPGRLARLTCLASGAALLAACASTPLDQPGPQHILRDSPQRAAAPAAMAASPTPSADDIPAPVEAAPMPPRPRAAPRQETYSVVVNQVEIGELLFAIARDAKLNVDVHPAVRGRVTLNAIEQTLPQILSRLARQVSLRYEFDGGNLVVLPDSPVVRHYPIDYVAITREARANSSIATQIASTGGSPLQSGGGSAVNNNSTTQIVNASSNRLWDTIVRNVRTLIGAQAGDTGASGGADGGGGASAAPASSAPASSGAAGSGAPGGQAGAAAGAGGAPAAPGSPPPEALLPAVLASPETGMLTVRATMRQHEAVQEYLDRVMNSARRQVLIEATIAEVQLNEQFQQGINFQRLRLDGTGLSYIQQPNGPLPLTTGAAPLSGPGGVVFNGTNVAGAPGGASSGAATPSLGVLRYLSTSTRFGNIGAAVSLLQSFGRVKVLSSPKLSVLNSQTALLKIVENRVYFQIGVQITPGTATTAPLVTYTSTPNTVPVGFVMSVTPQIDETGSITLNVRPTISRIVGFVNDPNPALAQANVVSRVPEIQTREIESVLKVSSGDIAVMGGLMQEGIDDRNDVVPGAASVPFFGQLFRYRNENATKTELVVFIRPVMIRDASLEGDFAGYRDQLPGADYFDTPPMQVVPRAWRTPAQGGATPAGAR